MTEREVEPSKANQSGNPGEASSEMTAKEEKRKKVVLIVAKAALAVIVGIICMYVHLKDLSYSRANRALLLQEKMDWEARLRVEKAVRTAKEYQQYQSSHPRLDQIADEAMKEVKRRNAEEQEMKKSMEGDAAAQNDLGLAFKKKLGIHYDNGGGVQQDKMSAVERYRKAAEEGDAPAQRLLDECLGKGEGLPQVIELPCKVAGRGDDVAKSAGVGTETVGDNTWSYRVIGDRAEIYKDGSSPAVSPSPTGEVAIPSTLGGKPVTSIGDHAFSGCSSLASVIIPSGVTNIGHRAFSDCRGLTDLTIPDGLTHIWGSAFFNCSSLTNVSIPDSVTYIGTYTFSWCSALTNMTIPRGVTRIKSNAFRGCSNLVSVAMSNGVTGIEDYAFLNCTSLTSVKIPSSMRSVGNKAFYNSALKVVNLPESRKGTLKGCKFPEKTKIAFYADE